MNRFSTVTRIAHRRGAAVTPTRRLHLSSRQCQQDTQQPASANEQQEKPKFSMKNYRGLEYPWVKVFLGAMFTYQLCYWGWEKMRIDEITAEKNADIKELEQELDAYTQQKSRR